MKVLPSSLASHLAGGVTTLATCWIVTRTDDQRFGFTDHDRKLTIDGVECQPENGLSASAMAAGPELATGGGDVAGSLSGPALTAGDLEAGFWDGAEVAVYAVNWTAPEDNILLRRAHIGEVAREGQTFRAELRGLPHVLEASQGRVFTRQCDADLGDTRCAVDLTSPAFRGTGTVSTALDETTLLVTGLSGFDDGWFAGGRLLVTDGDWAGFASEIASHRLEDTNARIVLWQAPPALLDAATAVEVAAGCSKSLATCRDKFSNALNFRGFPHMPGTDFVLSYPSRNTGENDGGTLAS